MRNNKQHDVILYVPNVAKDQPLACTLAEFRG